MKTGIFSDLRFPWLVRTPTPDRGNQKQQSKSVCFGFPRFAVGTHTSLARVYTSPFMPFRIRRNVGTRRSQAGFTLLELLTVIALLAVLAGVALMGYDGVQDQARLDATRFEIAELRKALLQFRRDSGSNDLPGQGLYDCTDAANGNPANANPDFSFPAEAGSSDAEKIAWCQHPANFWMLFADPLGIGWNSDTRRGWHGPYLQRKSGLQTIGAVSGVWVVNDAYDTPFELQILTPDYARIVSAGADRNMPSAANACEPAAGSDDMVLCLLR